MKTKTLFFITLLFHPIWDLCAQTDSNLYNIPSLDIIENNLEETLYDENISADDLLEELEALGTSKPNLNKLDYEVAVRVLELSDYQYYQLQLYLENYGALASIYELDGMDGFGQKERERLQLLAEVAPVPKNSSFFKDFFKKGKSKLLVRYQQV